MIWYEMRVYILWSHLRRRDLLTGSRRNLSFLDRTLHISIQGCFLMFELDWSRFFWDWWRRGLCLQGWRGSLRVSDCHPNSVHSWVEYWDQYLQFGKSRCWTCHKIFSDRWRNRVWDQYSYRTLVWYFGWWDRVFCDLEQEETSTGHNMSDYRLEWSRIEIRLVGGRREREREGL